MAGVSWHTKTVARVGIHPIRWRESFQWSVPGILPGKYFRTQSATDLARLLQEHRYSEWVSWLAQVSASCTPQSAPRGVHDSCACGHGLIHYKNHVGRDNVCREIPKRQRRAPSTDAEPPGKQQRTLRTWWLGLFDLHELNCFDELVGSLEGFDVALARAVGLVAVLHRPRPRRRRLAGNVLRTGDRWMGGASESDLLGWSHVNVVVNK